NVRSSWSRHATASSVERSAITAIVAQPLRKVKAELVQKSRWLDSATRVALRDAHAGCAHTTEPPRARDRQRGVRAREPGVGRRDPWPAAGSAELFGRSRHARAARGQRRPPPRDGRRPLHLLGHDLSYRGEAGGAQAVPRRLFQRLGG